MYISPKDLITFQDGEQLALEFEQILRDHRINIEPGSALERGLLLLINMNETHKARANTPLNWPSLGSDLQESIGVLHVIQLVVRNKTHCDFPKLVPHLRKLNKGTVSQTVPARVTDDASNKIFELFVTLAVMNEGRDLQVDDPDHSTGNNPDALALMPDDKRWGYACKVVHGEAPRSLYDRIVDGIDQIEKSNAQIGLVTVSFKNMLHQTDLFPTLGIDNHGEPILGAHVRRESVEIVLATAVQDRLNQMLEVIGPQVVIDTFRDKKALPGILVPVSAGIAVSTARGPILTSLGFLQVLPIEILNQPTRFTDDILNVLRGVNEGFTPNPRQGR